MSQQARPPLEPETAVALVWGLFLELSDDPEKQAVGEYTKQKFELLLHSTKETTALRYLEALLFEATSTLRNLSYRREGFKRKMELNNSILEEQIKTFNKLTGISVKDAKSLVPRLSFAIGGVSLSDAIANFLNAYLPTAGKVSGYEVFLLGAVAGYFLAEIILRVYGTIQISKAKKEAHYTTHIAWNRYIREAREVMRNFLVDITRLREMLYPDLGTLGPGKAFLGNIDKDIKLQIDEVIDDVVERHLPIVHYDIDLSPRLRRRRSHFAKDVKLQAGDSLVFSYSVLDGAEVNCHFFKEEAFRAWLNDKSKGEALYRQLHLSTGGKTICVSESGRYCLVFENPSYFSSRSVTLGCQILRDITRQFCL